MVKTRNLIIFMIFIFLVVSRAFCSVENRTQRQELYLENTAKYVGSGSYEWKIFIVAEDSILDQIDHVVYTLHPTYPNPIQKVRDRETEFAFKGKGWGEFNISAEVVFKNGKKIRLNHWLELKKKKPEEIKLYSTYFKPFIKSREIKAENTAKQVDADLWEWELFLVGDKETLDEINYVEYTLHPTFRNPVKKIEDRGDEPDKGFFLKGKGWGMFTVGIKIVFKDKEIKYLKHPLIFYPAKKKKS